MIGETLSHYKILDKLGAGGMGEVYLAEDTTLKRQVALKVLPPDLAGSQERLERFQREAETLAALDHPNIVTVFTVEHDDDVHFLTMQLVEGKQLSDLILEGGMPLERIFEIAIPLADALAAAHEKGVIHRDLKPANIMLSDEGRVKILDFGLAKFREEAEAPIATQLPTEPLTEEGLAIGTVPYMSPEQVEGKSVDHRSDLFSLGIILYEMATGQRPFQGDSPASVMSAILRDTPSSVTDLRVVLPRQLARIIHRCLVKDKERRLQTARELAIELDELKGEIGAGELLTTGATARQGPAAHRGRWPLYLMVALVLAAATVGWFLLKRPEAPMSAVQAVPLTSLAGSEVDPALSPRGDQVAFVWNGADQDRYDLYVMLTGSGEPLRLTEGPGDVRSPAWSPDNLEIAFLQRIDQASYGVAVIPALGGAQRILATVSATGFPGVDWSPDGKWLAVVDMEPTSLRESITLISIDSGEKRFLTTPPSSGVGDKLPVFSPDGRTLAFVRWYEVPRNEVYLTDLGGDDLRLLHTYEGWIRGLDWMPDGSKLVFASNWNGSSGLWGLSLNGELSQLSFGQGAKGLTVAAIGDRLVFDQEFAETNIWRVNGPAAQGPLTRSRVIGSTRNDWSPQFSPDGSRIAWASDRAGSTRIWVADGDGGNPVELVTTQTAAAIRPRWSPDGRSIAFGQSPHGSLDVYVMEVEGGFPRRLTDSESMDGAEGWSQDGRWIYFFSDRTGSYQVWKVPTAGGEPVQLTTQGGLLPKESADGRFVFYLSQSPPFPIWKVPVDGGEETLVLERPGISLSGFEVWGENLVYLLRDESAGPRIERFDLRTGQLFTVAELGSETRIGKYGRISVSPDGRWILYPQDDSRGADLVMIEDFH